MRPRGTYTRSGEFGRLRENSDFPRPSPPGANTQSAMTEGAGEQSNIQNTSREKYEKQKKSVDRERQTIWKYYRVVGWCCSSVRFERGLHVCVLIIIAIYFCFLQNFPPQHLLHGHCRRNCCSCVSPKRVILVEFRLYILRPCLRKFHLSTYNIQALN